MTKPVFDVPTAAQDYADTALPIPAMSDKATFEVPASEVLADIKAAAPGFARRLAAADRVRGADIAAALVAQMRDYAGVSQSKLASLAGRKQPEISAIENASGRFGPSVELLCTLADAAGMELTLQPKQVATPFGMIELADGSSTAAAIDQALSRIGKALTATQGFGATLSAAADVLNAGWPARVAVNGPPTMASVFRHTLAVDLPVLDVTLDNGTSVTLAAVAISSPQAD
jgi:transcriptional regulator with XRE-family HTH domain